MAFEEITLFEFDLEGAQFGPREMDLPDSVKGSVDADEKDVSVDVESEDSGGPGLGRMILMAVVVSVVAMLVARRLGGSDEDESTQIEFEEDEETAPEIGA